MATHKDTKATKSVNSTKEDFTVVDENRWENMSIEDLEALSEHNKNILSGYEATVTTVKNCQKKIKDILKKKRHSIIMDKIDAITPEQQFDMLDRIPHSKTCQKIYKGHNYETYTGFKVNYGETPIVECPHCALDYVLNNSWLGIDFYPSVEFDFTEYDDGL